ncbi:MAG: TonB-dependent receptor [Candidatus Eisenbacteria bacterium]
MFSIDLDRLGTPGWLVAFGISSLLVGAPTRALANHDHDLIDLSLEEILNIPVISVSKTEKPLLENSVSAIVVSREQILDQGYRDVLDVLRDLPGVYLVEMTSSEHAATEVMIRGVDANSKMLFLLDGEEISAPTGEPFTFLRNIPLISVKQVEVSYGAAASLYGADAIAGVVNIVTTEPDEDHPAGAWFGTGTDRTYEAQATHGFRFGEHASLSVTASFFTSSQEDLVSAYPKTFGAFDVDPKIESQSFHARLEAGAFDASYLRLFGSRNNALGFQPALYDYSGASTWDTENDYWRLGWTHENDGPWRVRSTLSYSRTELEPTSTYAYDFSGSQEFEAHSFFWRGHSTRLATDVGWSNDWLTWIGGAESEWFESIPKTDIDHPLGSYDIFYRNVGAFTQAEVTPTSWLGVTAGIRIDDDSRLPHRWNPRLGAIVHPIDGLRMRANWSTAYLAPSPHKMYERWGVIAEGEFVHLPNPDLQPETSETVEASIDWFPSDRSHLVLAGFSTRADDLWRIEFRGPIEIDGVNVVYQTNANVAKSSIDGFHVSGEYAVWHQWSLSGHYTLTDGTQTAASGDGEVKLNHMPRHLYQLGADWHGAGTHARITARGFDDITSNEANTELAGKTVPGTWTADALVEHQLTGGSYRLSVGVEAQNVFDRSYTKISKFDEFFFALPTTPQPRRSILVFVRGTM